MGKKLDVITDKHKCVVRAYVIEKNEMAKPITVDIMNNPKQKGWLGKRKGDTYKVIDGVTYKIEAIEEYSEKENTLTRNEKASTFGEKCLSSGNNSSFSTGSSLNTSTNLNVRNRVFWVFQNQTYEDESKHGYIFAGFYGPPARERVKEVRCGHIIIHSYRAEVVAVSVAKNSPYSWTRQDGEYGRRVDCEYHRLRRTISTSARKLKNMELCRGADYQPFNCNGGGNQGYLYDMTSKLRDYYISEIIKYNPYLVDEIPELRKYNTL